MPSSCPAEARDAQLEQIMSRLRIAAVLSVVAIALVLAGCTGMTRRPQADLTVMTYNLYLGTDVASIFAISDPAMLQSEVETLSGEIVASNFFARAAAIAASIKEAQPHLIGLQEVPLIRAGVIELDFRAILMSALVAAELDYTVAAEVQNAHIELSGAALTDFDVILARSDVDVARPMDANYADALRLPLPGTVDGLTVYRGYAAVDATVGGVTYRVVNTHLEATLDNVPEEQQRFATGIRLSQTRELVAGLMNETLPVILLGDFNTLAPDGPAYAILLDAGFEDTWQADSEGTGYTCCQAADLRNEASELSKRIDQIFIKGVSLRESAAIRTATVGDTPEDMTDGGLWPSDHAGVVAHLPVE